MTVMYFTILIVLIIAVATAEICDKKICSYEFVIRRVRSMTYQAENSEVYSTIWNGTHLEVVMNRFRKFEADMAVIGKAVKMEEVITLDGFVRNVIVVNGKFPGPTIEVMEGSQVKTCSFSCKINQCIYGKDSINIYCAIQNINMIKSLSSCWLCFTESKYLPHLLWTLTMLRMRAVVLNALNVYSNHNVSYFNCF